ncbi:hypothetical protein H7F15_14260 [Pontibacter sp. Tf4]|uniref:hypothetical protein n=1 Tax=Pontibacter sp. Tf4 TaxID=2761620 RepID=UPI001625CEAF|nr:hypothetical protein [Pontibacter sp. Tf4]MBB6612210.1 hypothetical protein [Pontibacter sp. Tf4]
MSARNLQLLLETAYDTENPQVFEEGATNVYQKFEAEYRNYTKTQKPTQELNFLFERVRLGVAIAFVKAYTRLADNETSVEALQVLQDAIRAKSSKEIDKIVQKKIAVFDNLYHEIFVNEERQQILALFEATLDAGAKEELDELMIEGLELLTAIDFEHHAQQDDDDEPLDEDFLKSIQ